MPPGIGVGVGVGEMIVHQSPALTRLFARIPARFQSSIHNHTVFACIGQFRGEGVSTIHEPAEDGRGIQVASTMSTTTGEVIDLPPDAIHNIEIPNDDCGLSFHLYGGDFGALMEKRTLWSTNGRDEMAFSFEALVRESVETMKQGHNGRGLKPLVEAIPAAKPLIENS